MYLRSTSNSSWEWSYIGPNGGCLPSFISIAKSCSLWHGSLSTHTLSNTSEKFEYFFGKTIELGFLMTLFEVITASTNAFIIVSIFHFSLTTFFRSFQFTIKALRSLASQLAASFSKPITAMSGSHVSAELQLHLHLIFIFGFWTFSGLVLIESLTLGCRKIRFSSSYLIIDLAAYNQGISSIRL